MDCEEIDNQSDIRKHQALLRDEQRLAQAERIAEKRKEKNERHAIFSR